ncbi:MAG: histidine--tRNA ligase [Candidatus Doudnabacteria bacterium]|nr:histidine--tRNA ligase [Candidatus Doudnabacteria bacterium]
MKNKSPQLLKGFRDFGPEQAAARNSMFQTIRLAFERFGFAPMETPALEYAQTLTGKYGAEEKLMYKFKDQGQRQVALRYDLTVPLARYYAQNRNELPNPFKRYALGQVWRAESPQKGRFREFYQCDVDTVGISSSLADAETIAAVAAALSDLGIGDYSIRINNRKILDGLLELVGVSAKRTVPVLRLLDKQDKISEKEVKAGLKKLGLAQKQSEKLFAFLQISATDGKELEDNFREVISENKKLSEGLGELADVFDDLNPLNVKNAVVDLKLARGLDYYTGTVCEFSLSALPGYGSIAGGGRYDDLIGSFLKKPEVVPAVGMSIGVDRLLSALVEMELPPSNTPAGVVIFNLETKLEDRYLSIAVQLRRAGIVTDVYYRPDNLEKQFKYAEKKKARYAVIVGADEQRRGVVKVKNLLTRQQDEVSPERLVSVLTEKLGSA